MKTFAKTIRTCLVVFAGLLSLVSKAQTGVLNPSDPIVIYNPSDPPDAPAFGTLSKWVKTNRVSFNTTSFKAYYYKGLAFRLKFPKTYQHGVADGKKYPLFLFFHGIGEKGSVYDNEYQLYHGGQTFMNAVDNGKFDGFLMYPQTSSGNGYFNETHYAIIREFINNYLIPEVKVDPFRIIVDGLSGGGSSTWSFTFGDPKMVAAMLPISAASVNSYDPEDVEAIKFIPSWLFQGGLDTKPDPHTARALYNTYKNAGANFSYTEYPTLGHGCWNAAWAEANFLPFINKAHKANPWPLYGRTEYCPGDPISQVLGVTAGFDAYEWRKDGVLIPGATGNTYTATAIGTYDCRIKKDTLWSVWSPIPVVIKNKGVTISPDIQIAPNKSRLIPSPDGSASLALSVPDTYASYEWQKEGNTTVIGTTNTITVSAPGQYKVKVNEQFGCSSNFSNLFTVIDANGLNGPPSASGIVALGISKTAVKLDWTQSSSPAYNETGFEIYRSTNAAGPYTLITTTLADAITYTDTDLTSNTQYFYKIRAINNNAASSVPDAVSAKTFADQSAPTAPANLRSVYSTRNSVQLLWDESSDDVGVVAYDVYVNGVKYYETDLTNFTVYNLQHGQTYTFKVKARDFANNASPFSNQISAQALLNGLQYKYFTFTGTWNTLPDFNTLDPDATGIVPNITLANRTQEDRFAYLWEGYINIPVGGTYTFRTNSDDGSRLWFGTYDFNTPSLVNNDGLHGGQNRDGSITLTAGSYPIAIAFYEQTGGQSMTLSWQVPGSTSFVAIPNSAFSDAPVVDGTAPVKPSNLVATPVSHKKINLSWTDLSDNESGFEIWRSTSPQDGYTVVGNVNANATSYSDSVGLTASTSYYYRIRSIGQYGESALIPAIGTVAGADANWRFNNNYLDATANGRVITANGTPTFNASTKQEGTHAINFNGSNQGVDFTTVAGDYLRGAYTSKSISFWMKSASNTGGRIVLDIGGNDNGLALGLNTNILSAGVASNNVRKSIGVAYTSTDWNYITLVYNVNTLKLYINGTLSASNLALGFNSVGATTNASRIAGVNGTNAFNSGTARFSGLIDNFVLFNRELSVAEIKALMEDSYGTVKATTLQLPGTPASPTNLTASGISTSSISVNWTDNSVDEEKFELYRSGNTNGNFILYKTLPANATSFVDTALYSNSVFYYKVRAINAGGSSSFSNEDSATSLNNIPVFNTIGNQYVRYGSQLQLNIAASDLDPENLTVEFANLPAFASYVASGNGIGTLTLSPAIADSGVYNDVTITIYDEHGGVVSNVFNITVNDNYKPTIAAVSNVALNEKTTAAVNLSATDQNADVLSWSFTGLPSFATVTNGNGTAQVNLAPGYADNGVYTVKVKVDDGRNGIDTTSFTITVNDVNPNKTIYVNFTDGTYSAPSPWNNTNKVPALNDNFSNLKDVSGSTTPIGIQLLTAWTGTNNQGVNTTNNSGIYPDAVLRSSYYTNNTSRTIKVYGLQPNDKHDFTFMGSRANPTSGVGVVTNYTINGQTVTLNTANNSSSTVTISNILPAADGSVTIAIAGAAGSSFGYLNSLVIKSNYDDGTSPAQPRNLTAQMFNGKVRLTWIDAAYNETAYEVYRATSQAGPYTLLNAGGNNANLQVYDDGTISGHTTYYYRVRTVNSYGASGNAEATVTTPNTSPVLSPITNVNMSTQQVVDINVTATDGPGETITLSASGLPVFATFTDNGNGTGVIHVSPGNTSGIFNNITITATDGNNATSTQQFNLSVKNANITSVYINFNQTNPAGVPWNNMNAAPVAGAAIADLKDESNSSSGLSISLLDSWTGQTATGYTTGNNSGLYPDNVMLNSYYYNANNVGRRIQLSGLSASKKYNLIFFASRNNNATSLVTRYTVGAQNVDLQVANNLSNTVKITDLSPDANGQLLITATGVVGPNAYIGALVIESYTPNLANPIPPANLTAAGISKDKIMLKWESVANSGYEVWRSTSANGTYTKRADVGANINTYTDGGLTAGSVFYYKVKALLSSNTSPFSNYAGASTVSYNLNINLNDGTVNAPAQPGFWNNTNALLSDGYVLPNMINDAGQNTGINFGVLKNFSGFNYYGATTGNNTGVYPDNVMKGFYYCNYADTAKLTISGLTLAHVYNFVFFGSRINPQVGVTAAYKIGNQVVTLDASNNTQNTVQISGVKPDADGSVTITIYGTIQGGFGYLNAMSIQGAPAIAPDPALGGGGSNTRRRTTVESTETTPVTAAHAFPNPFNKDITYALELKQATSKFTIQVLDMNGRVIDQKEVNNAPQGVYLQKLNLSRKDIKAGVYFIRVLGLNDYKESTKIIKQ